MPFFFCMLLVVYLGLMGFFIRDRSGFIFFFRSVFGRGLELPKTDEQPQKKKWCTSMVARVFSVPKCNSDSGSLSRLFSPLRTTVRAFIFFFPGDLAFLLSPTRVELRPGSLPCAKSDMKIVLLAQGNEQHDLTVAERVLQPYRKHESSKSKGSRVALKVI